MTFEIINDSNLPLTKVQGARYIAKQKGEITYFTGEKCPRGHIAKRYVSSKKCVECMKAFNKKRINSGEHQIAKKKWWLKTTYGLTVDQYQKLLLNQNLKCKLCLNDLNLKKYTHIDHDKITGKIRGILCHNCNVGIGHLKHNPELLRKAALYCEG